MEKVDSEVVKTFLFSGMFVSLVATARFGYQLVWISAVFMLIFVAVYLKKTWKQVGFIERFLGLGVAGFFIYLSKMFYDLSVVLKMAE